MVMGIVMSFRRLTQFFIRDWTGAPWAEPANHELGVDLNKPVGQALLGSFVTTCLLTLLSVGLCWPLGTAAAVSTREPFRGRGPLGARFRVVIPVAVPGIVAVAVYAVMTARGRGAPPPS
ncbi:ABC transporter permease subunit [Streptomyces goshikiensis]|uniref:hypothetical protein n=1 Tax=Streptomyces goshikiensis TaxID=1942 RepID=UPI00368D18DA